MTVVEERSPGVTPHSRYDSTEFDAFDDLAAELVQVPKCRDRRGPRNESGRKPEDQ
jgi:hypothetical protein